MAPQKPTSKQVTAAKQTATEKAASKAIMPTYQEDDAAQDERQRLIAEQAYYIAEHRGFQGDMAMDDWLQAEAEMDTQFAKKH